MFVDEYTLFTDIIMPFLKEHWFEIDLVEKNGESDGHLSKAELESARVRYIAKGEDKSAEIIGELIMRYDAICAAHDDASAGGDESALGISQHDVSVYAQLWDPEYRKREGKPEPEQWLTDKDENGKYW